MSVSEGAEERRKRKLETKERSQDTHRDLDKGNEDRDKQVGSGSGRSGEDGEVSFSDEQAHGPDNQGTGQARAKRRKETHGRWTRDRYDNAQRSLVAILRNMAATAPDACVLRPVLREQARKVIGDTGLLDHLLKHMADQRVSPEGERLRRRHNKEGHMEYWLQSPQAAEREDRVLEEETRGMSAELREVKEMRTLLSTVRQEATAAINELKGVGAQAAAPRAGAGGGAERLPAAVNGRAAGVQATDFGAVYRTAAHVDAIDARLAGLETMSTLLETKVEVAGSTAVQETEDLRRQGNDAVGQVAARMREVARGLAMLDTRAEALEATVARGLEEGDGRLEALTAAVVDMLALRMELRQRVGGMGALQQEVASMRRDMQVMQATLLASNMGPLLQHMALAAQAQQAAAVPSTMQGSAAPPPAASVSPTTAAGSDGGGLVHPQAPHVARMTAAAYPGQLSPYMQGSYGGFSAPSSTPFHVPPTAAHGSATAPTTPAMPSSEARTAAATGQLGAAPTAGVQRIGAATVTTPALAAHTSLFGVGLANAPAPIFLPVGQPPVPPPPHVGAAVVPSQTQAVPAAAFNVGAQHCPSESSAGSGNRQGTAHGSDDGSASGEG